MEQRTGSKLGKAYVKAVYCHPVHLTYMPSTSCEMPGWMKHKLESRLLGEISMTSDMQMTPPLWQKAKKKVGLKLNIQQTKIMASGPITSWQIDEETVRDFILGAPKSLQMVIAETNLTDAYSLEGAYDQSRQHIKKQSHYFANKGPSSQGYFFSVSYVWM